MAQVDSPKPELVALLPLDVGLMILHQAAMDSIDCSKSLSLVSMDYNKAYAFGVHRSITFTSHEAFTDCMDLFTNPAKTFKHTHTFAFNYQRHAGSIGDELALNAGDVGRLLACLEASRHPHKKLTFRWIDLATASARDSLLRLSPHLHHFHHLDLAHVRLSQAGAYFILGPHERWDTLGIRHVEGTASPPYLGPGSVCLLPALYWAPGDLPASVRYLRTDSLYNPDVRSSRGDHLPSPDEVGLELLLADIHRRTGHVYCKPDFSASDGQHLLPVATLGSPDVHTLALSLVPSCRAYAHCPSFQS